MVSQNLSQSSNQLVRIYNTGDFESIILYEVYQLIKSDENGGIIIKMPEFVEKVAQKAKELEFEK